MRKTGLGLVLVLLGLFTFACGGSDKNDPAPAETDGDNQVTPDGDGEQVVATVASCKAAGTNGPICSEYPSTALTADEAALKQECQNLSGTWATAACAHTDALGGCHSGQGAAEATVWYYKDAQHADVTAETVKSGCTVISGTFVEP